MASTYSALKIELIGTGEQSGTWGATTNVNLGDAALGEAITGSATVDFSSAADVTISLIDTNTTQTARNLRLNLTESGAGVGYAGNLILGSNCQIEKLYLVNNGTTATKTIKNTTGTGIAIPAGKSMFVFNNATNVVEAVNSAISMAVTGAISGTTIGGTTITASTQFSGPGTGLTGSASSLTAGNVSGIVAVVNGGTGVTTSTGSGNVVLSTSPVLVTPLLGTPQSGNLANCTGYPAGSITGTVNLATQVTGTLAVANGGTGVTASTGSGSVVLSSSPTLTTPILGTPTSGTLTSCTGLPLSTGVTGTLTVANGGTGVTSSTGTGSVVLSTSPTLVTPILGTPTSGNLVNCTFPTLNQNTTGNAATATSATSATTAATVSTTVASGATGTTQSPGTNNTTIATTAFVTAAVTAAGGGTMSSQNANAVAITGGTINGVTGTNSGMTVGTATNATTAATVSTTVASGAVGTTQTFGTNNTQIATTAFVQAALALLYPVGSIYSSTSATNPGTSFGFGTWVAFAAGRVMVGNGGGFSAGATGGSADATLVSHNHTATSTVTDPTHNHLVQATDDGVVGGTNNLGPGSGTNFTTTSATSSVATGVTVATSISTEGASATNANLQPYVVVYMWNRTA